MQENKNKYKLTPTQYRRVKELRQMSPAEYDSICKRCGTCCLIKWQIQFSDEWGPLGTRKNDTAYLRCCCENLDINTHECRVYGGRLGRSNCRKVTINTILADDLLPASCGYVEYVFGPAQFPAMPDWSEIKPISDTAADNMTTAQAERAMIPESVLWARYYQKMK